MVEENIKPMTKIELFQGDITQLAVDVVVNAANRTLLGGGGVDGRIHDCAGPELLEECRTLGGCTEGEAKITKGYNLPAKYIIHTVGPIFGQEGGMEEELLARCYRNSLDLARQNRLRTIAFPSISTGVFRFPKDKAAMIVKKTVEEYLVAHPDVFEKIIFVLFNDLDYKIYQVLHEGNRRDLSIADL